MNGSVSIISYFKIWNNKYIVQYEDKMSLVVNKVEEKPDATLKILYLMQWYLDILYVYPAVYPAHFNI